jgi:hypothetical protein
MKKLHSNCNHLTGGSMKKRPPDAKAGGCEVTLSISEGRKPPIHKKQRSAGVFQVPDIRWKTSALAASLLSLKILS